MANIIHVYEVFRPASSDVDWCENNYSVSEWIAEYYNTISNIPFLLFPPLMIYLFQDYSKCIDPGITLVWVLLMVVGVGSGYFHASLSFSGQMLDEIAILWVIMASVALWTPSWRIKKIFPSSETPRLHWKMFILTITSVGTVLGFCNPVLNAPLLLCTALPLLVVFGYELRKSDNSTVRRLGAASIAWWSVAIWCWLNDKLFCEMWNSFDFDYPQFHAYWHLTILIASWCGIVMAAYFFADEEYPHLRPEIRYWPTTQFCTIELGVPYVYLRDSPYRKGNVSMCKDLNYKVLHESV